MSNSNGNNGLDGLDNPIKVGRLKAKSFSYQIDKDLPSLLSLLRQAHKSGTIKVYVHLGGIQAIEFEETEKIRT